MKKILVIVDMQNDFIDGPLGTPEARAIVDNVCEKIREGEWDWIFMTHDEHRRNYLETQEGKKLPVPHCIMCTPGYELNKKVYDAALGKEGSLLGHVYKQTFGSTDLPNKLLMNFYPNNVECTLVGVCTDICVISNALLLKAHYPEMRIVVDAACCAGSTPEKHRMALEVMKSCQIDVLNEPESESKQVDVENYISDCGR